MSHVYQNCQRADRLTWTAWMKNQNIAAMNIIFLKSHRDFRILHSRTAKKTWQIMWRKRIFKWHPSKLPWIWIFGSITKVRTMEKNCYLGRLLWSCLKPPAGFAEREKKLYWCLDCCSEWMRSLYLWLVTCALYSWCWINKRQLSICEKYIYICWSHRFIATTLFHVVKEWPHSSGNIHEWPLNYKNWQ